MACHMLLAVLSPMLQVVLEVCVALKCTSLMPVALTFGAFLAHTRPSSQHASLHARNSAVVVLMHTSPKAQWQWQWQ